MTKKYQDWNFNVFKSKWIRIVVGSDELKEVKEYIYLGWIGNIYWDMDVEILWRIKNGWLVGFHGMPNLVYTYILNDLEVNNENEENRKTKWWTYYNGKSMLKCFSCNKPSSRL